MKKSVFAFTLLESLFFLTDLSEWNRDHVRIWLKSVSQMFDLEMPKVQKFPQTGTQLSSLSRRDFERITGDKDTASVLYRHLGYIQGRPEVDLVSDADEEEDEELDELKEPLSKPGLSQKYLGKHQLDQFETNIFCTLNENYSKCRILHQFLFHKN